MSEGRLRKGKGEEGKEAEGLICKSENRGGKGGGISFPRWSLSLVPSRVPDCQFCPSLFIPRVKGPASAMAPGGPSGKHTVAFS